MKRKLSIIMGIIAAGLVLPGLTGCTSTSSGVKAGNSAQDDAKIIQGLVASMQANNFPANIPR